MIFTTELRERVTHALVTVIVDFVCEYACVCVCVCSGTCIIQDTRAHTQHTRSTHVSIAQTQKHTYASLQARVYGHASKANPYHTRSLASERIHTKTHSNTRATITHTHTHAHTHLSLIHI